MKKTVMKKIWCGSTGNEKMILKSKELADKMEETHPLIAFFEVEIPEEDYDKLEEINHFKNVKI